MDNKNTQLDILKQQLKLEDTRYEKMLQRLHPIKQRFMNVYKKLTSAEIELIRYYKGTGYTAINGFILKVPININSIAEKDNDDYQQVLKDTYPILKKNIYLLDNLIGKNKTKYPINLYRGISGNMIDIIKKLKIGQKITFQNYTSASANPKVALQFTGNVYSNDNDDEKCCFLQLELPKNIPIFYLVWLDFLEEKYGGNFLSSLFGLNKDIKKTKKKKYIYKNKSLKMERFSGSEFEILLGRGCQFKLVEISSIPSNYSMSGLYNKTWESYENKNKKPWGFKVYKLRYIGRFPKDVPSLNSFVNTNKDNMDEDYIDDYYNQSPYLSIADPRIRTLIT